MKLGEGGRNRNEDNLHHLRFANQIVILVTANRGYKENRTGKNFQKARI